MTKLLHDILQAHSKLHRRLAQRLPVAMIGTLFVRGDARFPTHPSFHARKLLQWKIELRELFCGRKLDAVVCREHPAATESRDAEGGVC